MSIREKIREIRAEAAKSGGRFDEAAQKDRDGIIVRTSIIGIIANVFLAFFKAVIGILSNSIAIVLDAVNNISDAASSVITIVGTKLAAKEPDRKHPFGYGRIEYLTAMVISILVLYAGFTSFVESVKKILTPAVPDYSMVSLIIVAVAVLVKVVLGRFVKGVGERVKSDSLINSGADAVLDSVISASTLVAAIIYLVCHISLEAWLGVIIAAVIIKSGIEMLMGTISQLLGERASAELVREIKATVNGFPEVNGAYDLVLHDYGPDAYNGSLHIEVPDTLSSYDLDKLIRRISVEVYAKHNVLLTAVGVYAVNTKDEESMAACNKVKELVLAQDHVLQMHGFYYDKALKSIRFDLVVSFDAENRQETFTKACDAVREAYPGFDIQANMDIDYSEI